jgi:orotidine-5'-phosphate decarboxylase
MTRNQLVSQIRQKKSYLCVGLDTDLQKIPKHLLSAKDPLFEFNKQIIDATHPFCVSYKVNTAFYEALGSKGWESLEKTAEYLPKETFNIADAKRGDIGNTSDMYAKAFFQNLHFDAVTIAPYMGSDSIKPFLEYKDKWSIVLALTSNQSSADFQLKKLEEGGKELFKEVLHSTSQLGSSENMMYVVGATRAEELTEIRKIVPEHFLLIPGVGAQGGSLKEVSKLGMNANCGLLINSSRNIIYASLERDFANAAGKAAQEMQAEMAVYLSESQLF